MRHGKDTDSAVRRRLLKTHKTIFFAHAIFEFSIFAIVQKLRGGNIFEILFYA